MATEYSKCAELLSENGFRMAIPGDKEAPLRFNNDVVSIDIDKDEIVFIGEHSDWLHIKCEYFTLLGALVEFRLIPFGYKSTRKSAK